MQPKCVRPARLANCSKFVSIMTSRQALKGHMLVVLYMMCFWGNYAVTHARLVRGSLHDPTDGDKFLERLPGRLLRDGDSQDVASDKPFFPSQCKARDEWIPYHRVWNGDPNTDPPYKVPKLELPMQCADHNKDAPRMLVAANGLNLSVASWMDDLELPHDVYHANTSRKHSHSNSATEAESYLKFIAEHYDCLAKVTLFAHSHVAQTWHRRERLDSIIRRLQWHNVDGFRPMNPEGYHSTIYLADPVKNLLGTEEHPPYEAYMKTCDSVFNGSVYSRASVRDYAHASWILKWWDLFLGKAGMGPIPEVVTFSVGAEFLVTRERIRARPRQFYLDSLAALMDFKEKDIFNGYFNGLVWENIWPYVFGETKPTNENILPPCELYDCSKEPNSP